MSLRNIKTSTTMRVASSPWCRPIGYPNLNWEIDPTSDGATYDGEPKDPTRKNVATTTKQRRYNDYNFRSMITSAQQQRFYNTYTHRLVTPPPPPPPTTVVSFRTAIFTVHLPAVHQRLSTSSLPSSVAFGHPSDQNTELDTVHV